MNGAGGIVSESRENKILVCRLSIQSQGKKSAEEKNGSEECMLKRKGRKMSE